MPHTKIGHLNYLSNSNLDYNNPMNMRRFGAYGGLAIDGMGAHHHHHMGGHHHAHHMGAMHHHKHHHKNPFGRLSIDGKLIPPLSGIAIDDMGGIVADAQGQLMDKPFLFAGIALLAFPHLKKMMGGKAVKKKDQTHLLYAGFGALAVHFIKPLLSDEEETSI